MAAPVLRLVGALLAVGLIAGCGGGHKASPAENVTAPAATVTGDGGGSTTGTPTVSTPSASLRNRAAAACKARIASQSKLSSGSKQTLDAICSGAAASTGAAVRQEESQACRALVKSTVPPAYQAATLASCPKP